MGLPIPIPQINGVWNLRGTKYDLQSNNNKKNNKKYARFPHFTFTFLINLIKRKIK
jgi:hypothetical protein